MRLRFLFPLFIILTTMNVQPAWALGKIGHQVVCQLSYDLLSKDKQAALDSILRSLSDKDVITLNKYTYNKKDSDITFAKSCTWADAVKKAPTYERYKSWHFINVNRDTQHIDDNSCTKNCVTQAIKFHTKQLANSHESTTRLHALMFLGHWLGDIHQPLHVSFASDWGGNKNKITPAVGKCKNLHWYWDECLLYPLSKNNASPEKFNYRQFQQHLTAQLTKQLASAPIAKWNTSTVTDWANESLSLIREQPFNYCHLKEKECLSNDDETIAITAKYHAHYQEILHQRMLQAAVRLANLLSQSL